MCVCERGYSVINQRLSLMRRSLWLHMYVFQHVYTLQSDAISLKNVCCVFNIFVSQQ